jgi:PIN domain
VRNNFVLIDYENVQPESLTGLDAEHFKVLLFVGATQTKLAFEVAAAMQGLGSRAEYVKIAGNGSNALDFHIAFYIGHLSASDPTAYFHIISKDTGFDPLIQHLKSKKVSVVRSKAIEDIPLLKAANSKPLPEKVAVAVANLKQRGASKPRTVKTLSSTISSLFQKQLGDEELSALVAELQSLGYITVNENKVTYALPGDA